VSRAGCLRLEKGCQGSGVSGQGSGASGKLSGIGVSITVREKKVTVITPIEGSPAYRAGIRSGDVILKVDGMPVYDLQTAVRAMRGPVGTTVVVTISRIGLSQPYELRLLRETITVKITKCEEVRFGRI